MSDQLLRDWTWCSYYSVSGSYQVTDYDSAVLPTVIPELAKKIVELEGDGFVLLDNEIPIWKSVKESADGTVVYYSVNHDCRFQNGDTILKVLVKNTFCSSAEETISGAMCVNLSLHYAGNPIEGGKGQIKKCREIAEDIFAKWGRLKGLYSDVIVPYATRGGRGGWKSKIAERSFEFREETA